MNSVCLWATELRAIQYFSYFNTYTQQYVYAIMSVWTAVGFSMLLVSLYMNRVQFWRMNEWIVLVTADFLLYGKKDYFLNILFIVSFEQFNASLLIHFFKTK